MAFQMALVAIQPTGTQPTGTSQALPIHSSHGHTDPAVTAWCISMHNQHSVKRQQAPAHSIRDTACPSCQTTVCAVQGQKACCVADARLQQSCKHAESTCWCEQLSLVDEPCVTLREGPAANWAAGVLLQPRLDAATAEPAPHSTQHRAAQKRGSAVS